MLKTKKEEATNGIRTHDLSLTKRVLYQLSYSGDNCHELLEIGTNPVFDRPVDFKSAKTLSTMIEYS